ncbi:MAG: hypothetical protein ACK56I_23765, partial [bacterium]
MEDAHAARDRLGRRRPQHRDGIAAHALPIHLVAVADLVRRDEAGSVEDGLESVTKAGGADGDVVWHVGPRFRAQSRHGAGRWRRRRRHPQERCR